MAAEKIDCVQIEQFVENLPIEQKTALKYFSQGILASATNNVGYVLYGNKPMCIAVAHEFTRIPNPIQFDPVDIIGLKGFDFLKELHLDPEEMKFPFVECRIGFYRHFIFINRDMFISIVNENISLFKYILGRTLTAESFLDELLKSGDRFYDAFKWNKLVLGILLGYGTQNALLVSRTEDLLCQLNDNRIYFPFKNYETFIGLQQIPSLGFSTIDEELKKLCSFFQLSTDFKNYDFCPIPHFGCDLNLKETMDLLSLYEKNRETIIKIVETQDVLSNFLKRLCTTVSGTVRPPLHLGKQISKISYQDHVVLRKFMDCVALDLLEECENDSHFKKESLIQAFFKGIRRGKEKGTCEDPEWWKKSFGSDRDFDWYYYMNKARTLLQKIAKQDDMVELISEDAYYKVLLSGKDLAATNKIKNVTFNFVLYLNDGTIVDSGTIKKIDLEKLAPGIAYSFIGMKKGEEREIHIHPKYIYGWPLNPSTILTTANIKLLDFEEGEKEFFLPKLRKDINKELYDRFLNEYKKSKGYSYFRLGYYFAKQMKELDFDIDLEEFSKRLRSKALSQSFGNEADRRKFILDFNCYLFSRNYQGGRPPIEF